MKQGSKRGKNGGSSSRSPKEPLSAAIRRAEAEREAAPGLLRALMDLPAKERLLAASTEPRFASLALAILLLTPPAYRLSPESSAGRAYLALAVVSQLDPDRSLLGLLFDVTAHAWAILAGAWARRGHPEHAAEALAVAAAVLEDGTGDPLEEAHLLEQAAVLRRTQRRRLEARRFQRRAEELRRQVGQSGGTA